MCRRAVGHTPEANIDEVILQKQTWDGTRFVADDAGLVINTNDSLPFGSLTPGTVMRIVAYEVNAAYDNDAAATIRGRQLGSFTFKIVAAPSSTQGADNT